MSDEAELTLDEIDGFEGVLLSILGGSPEQWQQLARDVCAAARRSLPAQGKRLPIELLLAEAARELASIYEHEYQLRHQYPSIQKKYDLDMALVFRIRDALRLPSPPQPERNDDGPNEHTNRSGHRHLDSGSADSGAGSAAENLALTPVPDAQAGECEAHETDDGFWCDAHHRWWSECVAACEHDQPDGVKCGKCGRIWNLRVPATLQICTCEDPEFPAGPHWADRHCKLHGITADAPVEAGVVPLREPTREGGNCEPSGKNAINGLRPPSTPASESGALLAEWQKAEDSLSQQPAWAGFRDLVTRTKAHIDRIEKELEQCGGLETWRKLMAAIHDYELDYQRDRQRIAALEKAAGDLIADVRRRYPGEALRCPYMIALDAALSKEPTE